MAATGKKTASKARDRVCFVVSPIGEEGGANRKHADKVMRHLIEKSLPDDFEIVRADKISDPGIITNQIMQYIEQSDLVIADLTDNNPNVFYEVAIRHALRKPIIQIINKGGSIPFDISSVRTVSYDLTDPDALEQAQEALRSFVTVVSSTEYKPESPFSIAISPQRSNGSESDPMSVVLSEIQKISVRLRNLEIHSSMLLEVGRSRKNSLYSDEPTTLRLRLSDRELLEPLPTNLLRGATVDTWSAATKKRNALE